MQRWDSQDSEVVDRRAEGECLVHGLSTEGGGGTEQSKHYALLQIIWPELY